MSKNFLPVRLSHLFRHCSVGAIVRGPEYLMTVKDTREWTDKSGAPAGRLISYVEQVKAALGITQDLREPPVANELDNGQVNGACIPAIRFPSWMICPKCDLLHYKPWRGLAETDKPKCLESNPVNCVGAPDLEQVPWVLICAEGHMADVPWHYLAHRVHKSMNQKNCAADFSTHAVPHLRLIDKESSTRRLRCERDGCKASGAIDDSLQTPFGNKRSQPWIETQADSSEAIGFMVEINDARIHVPIARNALVIPPESRIRKGTVVARLYSSSQKRQQLASARTPLSKKSTMRQIASELRCSVQDIEDALRKIDNGYPMYGKLITQGLLFESEYLALVDELPDMADDEDFVTIHQTNKWRALGASLGKESKPRRIVECVDHLISVNRLKEILVLEGFKRMGESGKQVFPDIVGQSSWLPALELFGEGIFFAFNESKLKQWEKNGSIWERSEDFHKRFVQSDIRFDPELIITPRFLLLHTLAHLLIRQLETQAGYSAAALKERIYCTAGKLPMAGILIYVAVPDVVGSLGGLAELASPERFLPLLTSVFDHAEWCSLDPVCSEHEGQGPALLNRAACHGCCLIPEPSCAYKNVLLDRVFIKGEEASGIPNFLNSMG
jgi:hypothetical protein